MTDSKILKRVRIGATHHATGKTRHLHGIKPIPTPVELRIVQYNSDPGFYLFYCDALGSELTDTYHDSIKEAMAQAEWEFEVKTGEWESVDVENDVT